MAFTPAVHTEPTQEGHIFQTLLRRHTAVRGENVPQAQHIQLRLMISHKHRRPSRAHIVLFIFNFKPYAREEEHCPLETLCRGPLPESAVAHYVQTRRGDSAVGRAYGQGSEGGDRPAVKLEGGLLEAAAEEEEEMDCEGEDSSGREQPEEDRGHAAGYRVVFIR